MSEQRTMLNLNTIMTAIVCGMGTIIISMLAYLGNELITTLKQTHDSVMVHGAKLDVLQTTVNSLDAKSASWVTRQELNTKLYGRRYEETNISE